MYEFVQFDLLFQMVNSRALRIQVIQTWDETLLSPKNIASCDTEEDHVLAQTTYGSVFSRLKTAMSKFWESENRDFSRRIETSK